MENQKKLKVKDIITVTLLTLVNVVVYMAIGMFCMTPLTLAIYPILISLVQGIVFFVIGIKVQKPFAILIYTIVIGLSGFNIPYIICFVIGGVIAEIILRISGYGKRAGLTISYIVIQFLAAIGSTLYPYWMADATTYLESNGFEGDALQLFSSMREFFSLEIAVGVLIGTLVASLIGAWIANGIVRKHLTNKKEKGDLYDELV